MLITVTYKYLYSTLKQMLRFIRHDTCHQSTCISVKKIQLHYCISWLAQSCPILCDPMGWSLPGLSVHGILQARILECVAISSPRASSWPRDETCFSCVSCIGRSILFHWATWEALINVHYITKLTTNVAERTHM